MELIIDIPEEQYVTLNAKSQDTVLTIVDDALLIKAIKNGTPLPKGHGRLIDADEAIQRLCGKSCGCTLEECGYEVPCYSAQRINSAPTIIEADEVTE